jgi:hypothetical protein
LEGFTLEERKEKKSLMISFTEKLGKLSAKKRKKMFDFNLPKTLNIIVRMSSPKIAKDPCFGSFKVYMQSFSSCFVSLSYQGKDIVFKFIIQYSSLRDFGP